LRIQPELPQSQDAAVSGNWQWPQGCWTESAGYVKMNVSSGK
jgi:hypothetical protein